MEFQIFKSDLKNEYYFRLISNNGEVLLSSIGFRYKDECREAIDRIRTLPPDRIIPVIRNNKFSLVIKDIDNSVVGLTQTYESSDRLLKLKTLLLKKIPSAVYAGTDEYPTIEIKPAYPSEIESQVDVIYSNQEKYLLTDIYLDTNDPELANEIYGKFNKFLDTLGFEVEDESEAIQGSWIKRVIYKLKKAFQSEQVQERIKKGEHALELITIKKTQSEIDRNQVEAAASLIQSLEKVDSAAFKIGSLILIKVTDENRKTKVVSRTLTTNELMILEKNIDLLNKPMELLNLLESERLQLRDKIE